MRAKIRYMAWILLAWAIGGCGFQAPAQPKTRDSGAFRLLALAPADGDTALTGRIDTAAATDVSVAVFLGARSRKSRLVIGIVERKTLRHAVRTFDPTPGSVILRVVTFGAVPTPEGEPLEAFAAALDSAGKIVSYDSTPVSLERSAMVDGAFASTQLALDDESAGPN